MHELRFEFPGLRIGTAEYKDGPTGCTVFRFEPAALAAVDVRGGAAATRESTILDPPSSWATIEALLFTGGSSYGLEAASGVMQRILKERDGRTGFLDIPSVPAAVVYDFGGRTNSRYPDVALGAQACDAAVAGSVSIGRVGAGANVRVGKIFGNPTISGQGAAFGMFGTYRVLAVTVLNALGNILDREGRLLAGGLTAPPVKPEGADTRSGNTTLTVLITDAPLDRLELARLGVMAHAAMGRVIEPFHGPTDGDVLYTVSTAPKPLPETVSVTQLGVVAGRLAQDAVCSVFDT